LIELEMMEMSSGKIHGAQKGGTLVAIILVMLLVFLLFPVSIIPAFADDEGPGHEGDTCGWNCSYHRDHDGDDCNWSCSVHLIHDGDDCCWTCPTHEDHDGDDCCWGCDTHKPPVKTDEEAAYDDFLEFFRDVYVKVQIDAGDVIILDADTKTLQLGLNNEGLAALEKLLDILDDYHLPAPTPCPSFASLDSLPDVFSLTSAGLLTLDDDAFARTVADGDDLIRSYEFTVAATTGAPSLDLVLVSELGITELAKTTLVIEAVIEPLAPVITVKPPNSVGGTLIVRPPAYPVTPPADTTNPQVDPNIPPVNPSRPPTGNEGSVPVENPGDIGPGIEFNPGGIGNNENIPDLNIPQGNIQLPEDKTVLLPFDFVDPAVVLRNTQMMVFLALTFFVVIYLMLFSRRLIARRMTANSSRREWHLD